MIKPKALKFGDTIGIISPSSPTSEENIKKAYDVVTRIGFKVKMGKSPYEKNGYLSGTDYIRARDINQMFGDSEVNGIICMRGGYGSPRILDLIDYDIIIKNPKVFVGYSDITALHIAFNQLANLVTFHGPMVSSDMIDGFSQLSKGSLLNTIMGNPLEALINPTGEEIITINRGIGKGKLIGGNLSLIASTIGTPYEIDTKSKILLIEEIGEEPYAVDRMLNQLRLAGKFEGIQGIILGDFNDCKPKGDNDSLSLIDVMDHYIKPLRKPAIYNFQSGHCSPMHTLPLGVNVRLDANKQEIIILESCVQID